MERKQIQYLIRNPDLTSEEILALPTMQIIDVNILLIVKPGRKIGIHLSVF